MFVIPVPFPKEHKAMLAHCKEVLEDSNGMIAIHPKHNKQITALRTAVENGEGVLDKEATSHDDLFDSFRSYQYVINYRHSISTMNKIDRNEDKNKRIENYF